MKERSRNAPVKSKPSGSGKTSHVTGVDEGLQNHDSSRSPKRSGYAILALLVLIINGSWAVHHYQFENMPEPLSAEQAGKRGFSEEKAMKHVKALTELGPHPVGSDALDVALQYLLTVEFDSAENTLIRFYACIDANYVAQLNVDRIFYIDIGAVDQSILLYVLAASEKIRKMAHWEVDVEVDFFHANSGANRLVSGLFKGKTLVYSDLNHIVLRILPKYASEAGDNAILVSSHIDTVFAAEGAGDCSSCIAVMLELARGISHWGHGFKNAVIFLFNTGEEEGLNGAHSFITQHPWSSTLRMAIDLEAMGIGGKSGIFQTGPDSWAIENFAAVAKYPSGQVIAQDLFTSGAIKSATDFQVYEEIAGLSGLDFAYADNTAVYHTKNDKLKLLKMGSLQHLGDNMLAFLLHAAASSHFSEGKAKEADEKSGDDAAIYFDILGSYMIVYRQRFAKMLYNSVIMQSLLIWATSLLMGGYTAAISLALSCLSVLIMWLCSLSFSVLVAFFLPLISSSPVPFVSCPWLVVGLLASPALLGALTGQHLGYLILRRYLSQILSRTKANLSYMIQADVANLEAERWLYKAGLVQWLLLLIVGNHYKIGSSYLALVWLVSPAFAYGLLEATLSPARLPKPLKTTTLLLGLSVPSLISGGMFIRLAGTITGLAVRFESSCEEVKKTSKGAKTSIAIANCILFGLSLTALLSGIAPPFTEDAARAVNVVHVVNTTGGYGEMQEPNSYVSLFSTTPGELTKEVEQIGEGFVCGREKVYDFVTFAVKYSCWTQNDAGSGWSKSDVPALYVESDIRGDDRITHVSMDTKSSTRWTLAINTEEIEDFRFKDSSDELIPVGDKSSADGWHIIQYSGGKNAPTRFNLTLFWVKNYTQDQNPLLRLRTDVDRLTPAVERVLMKLPPWCSLFGKSTSPHTLAFGELLSVVETGFVTVPVCLWIRESTQDLVYVYLLMKLYFLAIE
ncbi:hypothetical protein RJ639_024198 [Escallonia herrerae]|uniref:Vacuolar membrane protease n=1 Tax=Escallonia herrerae TaxID=1293975 RepID=A0AA89ADU0_9ASTE|nr:hypothetical protein RJ639_024198 [Escallonia herrerae]